MSCKCKKAVCVHCKSCKECTFSHRALPRCGRPATAQSRKRNRISVHYLESSGDEIASPPSMEAPDHEKSSTTPVIQVQHLLQILGLSHLLHNQPRSRSSTLVASANLSDLKRCDVVLNCVIYATWALLYPVYVDTYFKTRHRNNSYTELGEECLKSLPQDFGAAPRGLIDRRLLRGVTCAPCTTE